MKKNNIIAVIIIIALIISFTGCANIIENQKLEISNRGIVLRNYGFNIDKYNYSIYLHWGL